MNHALQVAMAEAGETTDSLAGTLAFGSAPRQSFVHLAKTIHAVG